MFLRPGCEEGLALLQGKVGRGRGCFEVGTVTVITEI